MIYSSVSSVSVLAEIDIIVARQYLFHAKSGRCKRQRICNINTCHYLAISDWSILYCIKLKSNREDNCGIYIIQNSPKKEIQSFDETILNPRHDYSIRSQGEDRGQQ